MRRRLGAGKPGSKASGFTLLELMIVIAIIGILVGAMVFPVWERARRQARETALIHTLHTLRQTINNYVADKRKLPESLDSLVEAGYFKDIPIDPITQSRVWNPDIGRLPGSSNFGLNGIRDIHSTSEETGLNGTPYSSW